MTTDKKSIIQNIMSNLLKAMEIPAQITVEERTGGFRVGIDCENSGILIGYHGETLNAIQLIVNQIVYKNTGEWVKVSVSVGDYLEKREEQLRIMADRAVEAVMSNNKPETLPYLDPNERRFVHLYLEEASGVRTESVGEGEDRRLVIFPNYASEKSE
jgi:spoIIIJ-associated protein